MKRPHSVVALTEGNEFKIMGTIRNIDRRRESRTVLDLALTIWGVDTKGERFLHEARARDISLSGALLSGLESDLQPGDVIGILYAGKKARFRVVWVRYDEAGDKMQAAVHRISSDACPWQDLLPRENGPENTNTRTDQSDLST